MLLFNDSALAFCNVFAGQAEYHAFAGKSKSELKVRHRATNEMCMNYMMDPESDMVNFSRDM